MQLTFLVVNPIGIGADYDMLHTSNGSVWHFRVDSGRVRAYQNTPFPSDVPWGTLETGSFPIVVKDKAVSLLRLKNIPRVGIYGVWHQAPVLDGDILVSPERHRLGIWASEMDLSHYLIDCSLTFNLDTPVASLQMTLNNPNQMLVGEEQSKLTPGTQLTLHLAFGDSEWYPMGVFFLDRTSITTSEGDVSLEGRNRSGKLLKDQTFDENNSYPWKVFHENVEDLLENALITNYQVQENLDPDAWKFGIRFPPEMSMLDGLFEMIRNSRNWQVRETMEGELLVGSTVTFDPIQLNSRYEFQRGQDVFSRSVVQDDNDVYSRVCCYFDVESLDAETGLLTTSTSNVYQDVDTDLDWEIQPSKTLYVQLAKNTESTIAEEIAEDLAERIATAGTIETFTGPIRPHLLPGDEALIIGNDSSRTLGLITTVKHTLGRNGFVTEFTVDSGGRLGQSRLKDYLAHLTSSKQDKPVILNT